MGLFGCRGEGLNSFEYRRKFGAAKDKLMKRFRKVNHYTVDVLYCVYLILVLR